MGAKKFMLKKFMCFFPSPNSSMRGEVHGTSLLHSKASIEAASNSTAEELSRSESGSSSEELGGASSLSAPISVPCRCLVLLA